MTAEKIVIRFVKDISDSNIVKTLADLHSQTFPKSVPFPYGLPSYWWIAYCNKVPVAFAFMCGSDRYPDTGYFGRVGVLPKYRGRGLQKKFMKLAEKKAKSIGWTAMVSDTRNKPFSAANFKAMKYTQFTPEDPWDTIRAIYWRKEL